MGQLASLLAVGQAAEVLRERAALAAVRLTEAERRWLPLVVREAGRAGVEPALAMAVVSHESGFRADAINPLEPKGGPSVGLMQVQLATGRGALRRPALTQRELLEPETNVQAGTRYLADQLRRYRWDYAAALAAYNAGTAFRTREGRFVNQRYVDRVLDRLAHYRGVGRQAPATGLARAPAVAAAVAPWMILAAAGAGLALLLAQARAPRPAYA